VLEISNGQPGALTTITSGFLALSVSPVDLEDWVAPEHIATSNIPKAPTPNLIGKPIRLVPFATSHRNDTEIMPASDQRRRDDAKN
jgi:hypothetical protein